MGNRPSGTNDENHKDDDEACVPCFFLDGLRRLRSGRSSDAMGSPLPATPVMERQRRQQVAAAMSSGGGGGVVSKAGGGGLLLPPRCSGQQRETVPPPPSNGDGDRSSAVAPIHEGPDAERLLQRSYELQHVLGVGSTSTVQQCRHRTTGTVYACKIIDVQQIEERFQGMMGQFQTEIDALRQLQHPGIIGLYDVYMTPERIYIVMECMRGGELFDYVVQKGTLTEEEASHIVRKVTSALVYMHDKNIVHRDLKPENLLLKRKPSSLAPDQSVDVKIIDFGLSKTMEEPVARTFLGTRGYLAPEMLQRRNYTRAVDTWALGVIVFVLLCGCLPFDDDSATVPSDDLVRAKFVLRFPRWAKHLSSSAKDLLTHLLDVNPMTRYTAEQAFNHSWVQGRTAPKESMLQSPGRIRASPSVRNGKKYAPPSRESESQTMSPENPKTTRKNSL